jgi:hypothetical protein
MCETECCGEKSDIFLTEPYLEFDSFGADEDPFKRTAFLESCSDYLPSPTKFSRSESTPLARMEASCCRGAILSLVKPHKILAVAPDILCIAGFTSDQICGRSINVLCGPRTDVALLTAAIKNTGHDHSSTIKTVLNSSTGAEQHVTATFSPYRRASEGSLGGCLMQIDCIYLPDLESSSPVFSLDDFNFLCDSPSTQAAQSTPDRIGHPGREVNVGAGLDDKAERVQRQQGCCSSDKSLEPVLLLHEFGLLSDSSTSPQPSPKSPLQRRLRREANLAAGLENEAERRRQEQRRRILDSLPPSL